MEMNRPDAKMEVNMLNAKFLFGLALLVPLLAAMPAEAQKKDVNALRAECFRQANEAVAALGFSPTNADKNATGLAAYRQCAQKKGIRP
jgi:hypothetical protein